MIEILFGESEGVAMKLAKNYQQPDYEDGPTAWLGEKPDKATFEDMFAGEAVGGTSAEVIILPFMLDIGSLSEPLDGTYRKKIILEQYGVYWNEDEKEEREELEQAVETYVKELQRMEQFAKQGESFRIWYSNKPYSLCGLCHASRLKQEMALLKDAILTDSDLEKDEVLQKHAEWVAEFLPSYPEINRENIDEILRQEIGKVFVQVLEDAGVYKCTPEGREAFLKFVKTL